MALHEERHDKENDINSIDSHYLTFRRKHKSSWKLGTETDHNIVTYQQTPIYDNIFKTAEFNPHHHAILTPQGHISYSVLSKLVCSFATRFAQYGIGRNSVVAIWDIGGIPFTISGLAVALLGGRFVAASKFAILIAPRLGISHHIRKADQVSTALAGYTIPVGEDWMNIPQDLPDWSTFPGPSSANAPYMIAQSSGSTGSPKFIELSHQLLKTRLDEPEYKAELDFQRSGSLFGLSSFVGHVNVLYVLLQGKTFVAGQDPVFHLANRTQALVGSPAQFRSFIDHIPPGAPKFARAISVGAPITQAMIGWSKPHFESLSNIIGSTEVGYLSSIQIADEGMDIRCVGRPPAHIQVQIVDESNRILPHGEEGIIRVKSPQAIPHYLIGTESDKDIFQDGFFYPGDTGFLDQHGFLYVTGRTRDHFNIDGTKINASRVDELISSVSGVKDVMAFMDADEQGFTLLSAAILVHQDVDRADIIKAIKALPNTTLFKQDVPRRIYFVASLPRNDNGKLMRSMAQMVIETSDAIDLFVRRP